MRVFLGGSCNPTTWRTAIAIPMLEQAGVSFYNPQVEVWHPSLIQEEAEAKQMADYLLFVIDGQTRAIASILEATEFIVSGSDVRLVIEDLVDGIVIEGQVVTGRELKDLNRARAYLQDLANRLFAPTYGSVNEAVAAIIEEVRADTPA